MNKTQNNTKIEKRKIPVMIINNDNDNNNNGNDDSDDSIDDSFETTVKKEMMIVTIQYCSMLEDFQIIQATNASLFNSY